MFDNFISSPQNPKVKRLMALQQKSSARREDSLFVVEGLREVERCIEAGYELDSLFCCPSLMQGSLAVRDEASTFEVSPEVYARIAYRGTTEGVIAIVRMRHLGLESLRLPKDPLLVVLESVEKPGNLGAVLRTADAARVDAVIVCDPLTDLFNPNLIRSSLGAFFTVPCVACSSAECIAFLRRRGVQILTAQLQDSRLYYDTDMRRATDIVMGTESTGLSPQWRQAADAHIRIPMLGRVDSLNVSVSAAILVFEAVRQRRAVE